MEASPEPATARRRTDPERKDWLCLLALLVAIAGLVFAAIGESKRPREPRQSATDKVFSAAEELLADEALRAKQGNGADNRSLKERVLDKAKDVRGKRTSRPTSEASSSAVDDGSLFGPSGVFSVFGGAAGAIAIVLAFFGWWKRGEDRDLAIVAAVAGAGVVLIALVGVFIGGLVCLVAGVLYVLAKFDIHIV